MIRQLEIRLEAAQAVLAAATTPEATSAATEQVALLEGMIRNAKATRARIEAFRKDAI